jgi:hypothetical protein
MVGPGISPQLAPYVSAGLKTNIASGTDFTLTYSPKSTQTLNFQVKMLF